MKFIRILFAEAFYFMKSFVFLKVMWLRLKMAIYQADMLNRLTDKRYWVLPSANGVGFLVSDKSITGQRRKYPVYFGKSFLDLEKVMFYRTGINRAGDGKLSPIERFIAFKRYKRYKLLIKR